MRRPLNSINSKWSKNKQKNEQETLFFRVEQESMSSEKNPTNNILLVVKRKREMRRSQGGKT